MYFHYQMGENFICLAVFWVDRSELAPHHFDVTSDRRPCLRGKRTYRGSFLYGLPQQWNCHLGRIIGSLEFLFDSAKKHIHEIGCKNACDM